MNISNLLQSGFEFSEDEHELRLKYILFNCLIGSNMFLVSIAGLLRFSTGNLLQGYVDFIYVFLAALIALLARRSQKFFQTLVLCMMLVSLVIVSLTYKFLSSDIAGISWFLVLIMTAFFLTEKKVAYVLSFVSLLLVVFVSFTSASKNYTYPDIFYGIMPLLICLISVQFYEKRNALSRERLRVLNTKLQEKVENTTTELSLSKDRFRNLVENLSDWVWEIDKEGAFVYCSPSVLQILGYEPSEVEGVSHLEFLCDSSTVKSKRPLMQYSTWGVPFKDRILEGKHKDGSSVALEVSGQPIMDNDGAFIGYRGVSRDITARLSSAKSHSELKERLHQAQKMEAIGTLAGGIAHDFNNILSVILGYAEIARNELPEESATKENINQVVLAGKRATALVRQILTFSRKGGHEKEPLRMGLIVREALKMLRSSLPATIAIKKEIDLESGLVLADPTNIHQIVMNLCTNASHAIGNEKGTLEVTLSRVDFTTEEIVDKTGGQAGSFVLLMVRDDGSGMDEKTASRIFEPYFTTKKQEEGTGLGLAVIHGIVEEAHGFIELESHPGEGSCFSIYLPTVDGSSRGVTEAVAKKPLPRGNEHILIVDDEPDLTEVAEIHLTRLGYTVTTKTSAPEALQLFLAAPDSFDLLITDQTMPDMTGGELAQAILKIKADLPVILYTGYTSALSVDDVYAIGIKSFIEKPMSNEVLARTVRRLLDEKPV